MSNAQTQQAWESVWDQIHDHIDFYFEDGKKDDELISFIYDNENVKEYLWIKIARSKLGEKIAEQAFDNLPEGSEDDPNGDR